MPASPDTGWPPVLWERVDNPSWGQLDLRVQYIANFGKRSGGRVLPRHVQRHQRSGCHVGTMDLVAGRRRRLHSATQSDGSTRDVCSSVPV